MLLQTLPRAEEFTGSGMEVERRAVVRYLCDQEVAYYALSMRERLRARVRNVSREGIGLLLTAPIEPGTKLVIEMKTVDPATSHTLVASVVHATMQEEGSCLVGCKFLTRPTEEDLLALL
jgi:c-di-GMP-binding flagellar brake protein YcgR